jgi:hypothetical protein
MNEGIVEGGINVSNAEDKFAFCHLRTERDGVFFLRRLDFLGGLERGTLGPIISIGTAPSMVLCSA